MKRIIVVLLFTLTAVTLALSSPASACTALPPDPWFREALTVGQHNLPAGVTIQPATLYAGSFALEILNPSATPLYVLTPQTYQVTAAAEIGAALPPGLAPAHKIASNEPLDWIVECPSGNCAGQWVRQFADADRLYLSLDEIDPRLQQDKARADNRPENVELPAPQTSQLSLAYAAQLVVAPITVTYVLNPDYDPHRQQDSGKACEDYLRYGTFASFVPVVPYLCAVSAIGVLAFLAVSRRLRAKRQNRPRRPRGDLERGDAGKMNQRSKGRDP